MFVTFCKIIAGLQVGYLRCSRLIFVLVRLPAESRELRNDLEAVFLPALVLISFLNFNAIEM